MNSLDNEAAERWKHQPPGNWTGAAILVGGLLALIGVLLARDPLLFWNDDYELSILPAFADVARSWGEGHLPLLSPSSWVCGNLAGEYQYGTFSIFINLAVVLIWKLPLTFPQQAAALSTAHLVPLALGGYLLGRERKLPVPLAVMVGLVAAANGWVICWGATDWFGALAALAWLPWAWWGLERAVDPARGRFRFLWPVPFVYLLVTGGFPYTVLMLLLLAGWLFLRTLAQTRRLTMVGPVVLAMLLAFALAAPAWLALLDYLRGSARAAQESAAHLQWVVPVSAWPGLILPGWTVQWADFSNRMMPHTATEMACGLVAPVALLLGFIRCGWPLVRRLKWDLVLLVALFAIAMLPTASVFRWSFRWLPFLELVLALCAGQALQMFGREPRRFILRVGVSSVAVVAISVAVMYAVGAAGPHGRPFAFAMLGVSLLWAALEALPLRAREWAPAALTLVALWLTYIVLPTNVGVPKYHLAQSLTQPEPLDPQRLYLSLHPPPELSYRMGVMEGAIGQLVRPGSTSMWAGLRFINGYSPIRPAGVAREFDVAIHGEVADWVSEYVLNSLAGPDGELARLGVDGLVVADQIAFTPQPEAEWLLAASSEEGRVYHRRGPPSATVRSMPAVAPTDVWPAQDVPGAFSDAKITNVVESRNAVAADVAVPPGETPALVAFSRPYFRGYRASVAGKDLAVESYRGLMPVVRVPAGASGRLELIYRPFWLVAGFVIAACAAVACVGSLVAAVAADRRRG